VAYFQKVSALMSTPSLVYWFSTFN
jgi:hypothetical protein